MNDSVPRVSYLKSVDYFLLGSFVFVFMTLIEYVLVLKQTRKEKKRKNEKNKETIARDRKREAELLFPDSEEEKVMCCPIRRALSVFYMSIIKVKLVI